MPTISDRLASIIVFGCWLLFAVVWFVTAFFSKRTTYQQSRAESLRYKIPAVLAAVSLLGGNRSFFPLNVLVVPHTETTRLAVVILSCGGFIFCLWARWVLGKNWSATVTVKAGHELVQRGPYRIVRHPIYTGLLVMSLGIALINGHAGAWLGLILLFVSFWIKSGYEEKMMGREFPQEYPAYAASVKRIIPFVI